MSIADIMMQSHTVLVRWLLFLLHRRPVLDLAASIGVAGGARDRVDFAGSLKPHGV